MAYAARVFPEKRHDNVMTVFFGPYVRVPVLAEAGEDLATTRVVGILGDRRF